jgi:hypothetical protein
MLLALMATVCAISDSIIEHKQYPEGAPWLYDDDLSGDNPNINGLVTWAFALIRFSHLPCSNGVIKLNYTFQLSEHRSYLSLYIDRVCQDRASCIHLLRQRDLV